MVNACGNTRGLRIEHPGVHAVDMGRTQGISLNLIGSCIGGIDTDRESPLVVDKDVGNGVVYIYICKVTTSPSLIFSGNWLLYFPPKLLSSLTKRSISDISSVTALYLGVKYNLAAFSPSPKNFKPNSSFPRLKVHIKSI